MNRRLLSFLLIAALALCGAPTTVLAHPQSAPAAAAESGNASQMIERNTQRILTELNARKGEFSQDQSALRSFVTTEFDAIFDRVYSARLVLGRHARGADAADITLFADALIDGLLQRYGTLLLDFGTQISARIKSEEALPRNVGVRVSSELLRRGEAPIALDYLVRQDNGQWKVFDVIIEGVSMVQTFRQQFDAELQRKSIREVANELRAGQREWRPYPSCGKWENLLIVLGTCDADGPLSLLLAFRDGAFAAGMPQRLYHSAQACCGSRCGSCSCGRSGRAQRRQ